MVQEDPSRSRPRNGLGTAALVLGVVAIVFAFVPIIGEFVAAPAAVTAVIFGLVGLDRVAVRVHGVEGGEVQPVDVGRVAGTLAADQHGPTVAIAPGGTQPHSGPTSSALPCTYARPAAP